MMESCAINKAQRHKDQPKYIFVARVGYVFAALCVTFVTAGFLSYQFWHFFFRGLFPVNRISTAEEIAIKPLLNMTMYSMPYGFIFLAIGCFLVCVIVYLHLTFMNATAWWERRQEKSHAH